MRHFILACTLLIGFSSVSSVRADNPYRIRMAYERINLNAYRRMMFQRYPTAFGKRFWGFVDNHLLQTNGPADQVLKLFLEKLQEELDGASMQTAQRTVELDDKLVEANSRMDRVLEKLGIEYKQEDEPIPTGPTDNLSSPAKTPAGITFEVPTGAPSWPWAR